MMEWALAILLGFAVLLLMFSFIKNRKSAKNEQKEIDKTYFSIMDEITQLQNQIRNIELDNEITAREVGGHSIGSKERAMLREVLDLYKRGYSIESIAAKKRLNEIEIEELLSPYHTSKDERSTVANGS